MGAICTNYTAARSLDKRPLPLTGEEDGGYRQGRLGADARCLAKPAGMDAKKATKKSRHDTLVVYT